MEQLITSPSHARMMDNGVGQFPVVTVSNTGDNSTGMYELIRTITPYINGIAILFMKVIILHSLCIAHITIIIHTTISVAKFIVA